MSATGSLRVATYNVHDENRDAEATAQVILEASVDVVALQEVTPAAEEVFTRALSETLPHLFRPAGLAGGSVAVASRHPLADPVYLPSTEGRNGAVCARIRVGDQQVSLSNVHLEPLMTNTGVRALLDLARLSRLVRRQEGIHRAEIAAVLRALDRSGPCIVLGDFNCHRTTVAREVLEAHGFIDSVARTMPLLTNRPTHHSRIAGIPVHKRVDLVYTSPDADPVAVEVRSGAPSDHDLVVVDLRLQVRKRD